MNEQHAIAQRHRQAISEWSDRCIVCGSTSCAVKYESTFAGDCSEASAYFLTHRVRAVHGRVVECSNCRFTYTSPRFTAQEYSRIYRAVPAAPHDPAQSRAIESRFKKLASRTGRVFSAGRYVDVGCGSGGFLKVMSGFEGRGIDVAPFADRELIESGQVLIGDFAEAAAAGTIYPAGTVDFVTMWDVIEHLPEPEGYFRAAYDLLRPGGQLLATLPNVESLMARLTGESWNCVLLEHLWYFSPRSLSAYLARFGFVRREVSSFNFDVHVAGIFERLTQTYALSLRPPAFLRGLIVPVPAGVMFVRFEKTV